MELIKQHVSVSFTYHVHFTQGLFDRQNTIFADVIQSGSPEVARKVLFVLDEGMYRYHPDLFENIRQYASQHENVFQLVDKPVLIPGGETSKNDPVYVQRVIEAINEARLDRHSYVAAVGGGAVIDAVGYAAATAHRGVRLIRVPTTVLAQNDAAVGVKNGINAFGKKNFLGTFVPPHAVLNDYNFLHTLDDRDWRSGISEAVKVALLKDAAFFAFLEEKAQQLDQRDEPAMHKLIYRCAELHLEHIATSGDPFEMGSSRPLDFGHWAAHKLEQLTNYELRHGEAVAIGLALDVTYSRLKGMLSETEWNRILEMLKAAGFRLYVPELNSKLNDPADERSIFSGLEEFREHLGGELTIMLLEGIGRGVEVHEADYELYRKAIPLLEDFDRQPAGID